jgi:beta-xylosidase
MRRRTLLTGLILMATVSAGPAAPPADAFHPGEVWLDTDGKSINNHGGGFVFVDGTYYWYGEHKIRRRRDGHIGVGCYSSTDLVHWKNEGLMLASGGDGELADGCVIERPKVLLNPKTKKFVMWFHLEFKGEGYKSARTAVAVADEPTGPFTYVGSFRPDAGHWPVGYPDNAKADDKIDPVLHRDFKGGQMSRDMTLFQDDDGTAYQITASEENATLHVSKLTDDYLHTSGEYARILVGRSNEAPAVFKTGGKYYLISSGTTGWAPNAARLAVADHIMGPWKRLNNPCVGPDDQVATTFQSQAAAVLPVAGKKDAFIYVGDRWNARDLPNSGYIWLPIDLTGRQPTMAWKDAWDLSVFGK